MLDTVFQWELPPHHFADESGRIFVRVSVTRVARQEFAIVKFKRDGPAVVTRFGDGRKGQLDPVVQVPGLAFIFTDDGTGSKRLMIIHSNCLPGLWV